VLDDFSGFIVACKLCTSMSGDDVTGVPQEREPRCRGRQGES
jgi:hypothetical protein